MLLGAWRRGKMTRQLEDIPKAENWKSAGPVTVPKQMGSTEQKVSSRWLCTRRSREPEKQKLARFRGVGVASGGIWGGLLLRFNSGASCSP